MISKRSAQAYKLFATSSTAKKVFDIPAASAIQTVIWDGAQVQPEEAIKAIQESVKTGDRLFAFYLPSSQIDDDESSFGATFVVDDESVIQLVHHE